MNDPVSPLSFFQLGRVPPNALRLPALQQPMPVRTLFNKVLVKTLCGFQMMLINTFYLG